MPQPTLQAPFPWFGGKSRVSDVVWQAFGDVRNYVEPFFGSGAVLLNRPLPFDGPETVNDKDGYLANFWRAIAVDPEAVAQHADWPVNENDLHARHSWLVNAKAEFVARLEGDPYFYDAKIAGWWVWGICSWIGSGWCSGSGPWQVVNRKLVHVGDAGRGVNRKRVHVGDAGQGEWFAALSQRLRRVRVCSGDWARVTGDSVTIKHGLTGVFLDPPYADTAERAEVYSQDDMQVAHQVREWAIANGDNPRLRIALCGYEGEHQMPEMWHAHKWKAQGGYGSQSNGANLNSARERIWFSPHCVPLVDEQAALFG